MRRTLSLAQGPIKVDLSMGVPVPEISGISGGTEVLGDRLLAVRWPLSPADAATLRSPWDLVVWSNARSCWTDSERFVQAAIDVREAIGPAPVLWAPRLALPGRLAFLHSLGIDLLDTTEALFEAGRGAWLTADADAIPLPVDVLDEERKSRGEGPAQPVDLARMAEVELLAEEERVRRWVRAGRLRELVETRIGGEPRRGELLRYFDRLGEAVQSHHTPVTAHGIRPYTTKESLRRPEVARYRQRFLSHYRPPSSKSVLVLLPCSQTKPYANSPSHRRFARAISEGTRSERTHTVSVTSPLGLVPRELECTAPCRNYDIPVTGDWDEDERGWVLSALRSLLAHGTYTHILVHLPTREYSWLESVLPHDGRVTWTASDGSASTPVAIRQLSEAVRGLPVPEGLPGPMGFVRESLQAMAGFQFTPEAAAALFEGEVRLGGRPWFQHLFGPGHTELGTWKEETGLWRLTIPGVQRVVDLLPAYRVEVRFGVEIKGDLFCPGVMEAGPELRVGDDAFLVRRGEVLAVGEATLPGSWMARLPRGLAVKVRHRAHAPPRSPTVPTGPATPGPNTDE